MKKQRDIERGAHDAKCQPFSGNGGGAAASDRNRRLSSYLKRVSIFGAAGAVVVALMGLMGYVPGLGLLGSVREGYIPMAPSTAISFIVLGGILLSMTLRPLSGVSLVLSSALAALVSLFGALEVAGYFTGRDLNFEDALVPAAGYLGEIPIARMSSSTGALFLLAGLAAFALLLRVRTHGRGTRLGHWAGSLGSLVVGIGLLFFLAYFFGNPLLYGRGATVPMALTTALAFLMLGAATVGVSGEEAIPVSLLTGAKRGSKPMNARKRFLLLTLIMVGACATVMTVMTVMTYRHELREKQGMLQIIAKSQARLIEAVARYGVDMADMLGAVNPGPDASAATLSQILGAHERYMGFGETGEFTLARHEGDSIVFVLRHRHSSVKRPAPVAFDTDLAEPMRRALKGLPGTVIGLDYRGETVMAAHEPVAVLNLGIVAKIDLAEIRAPLIRSVLAAAAVALLVVLASTRLFSRIGNPMITRLEAHSRDLEKEVDERKRAEAQLEAKNMELEQIVYVTSHDLRSPLVNIEGYGKELEHAIDELRSALDSDQTPTEAVASLLANDMPDALRFIRTSTFKMDALLAGLLKLSRLGRTALVIDSLDMNELFAEVAETSEFQTREAGAELEVGDLPPCKGDAVQVNQVFSNLFDNALKYLDPKRPGAIRISGRVEGERSVYCVEDNGIGIDQAHRQNVFEIFHQLDPAKSEGEGLGLTIIRQILNRLSGDVWVESRAGEGSRFYVALPAVRRD